MCMLPAGTLNRYPRHMVVSERHLLDALGRTPFVNSDELVLILGKPYVPRSTEP